MSYFPPVDIDLIVAPGVGVPTPRGEPYRFAFSLDRAETGRGPETSGDGRMLVQFRVDASILLMGLLGAAIWNNIEVGALVECRREPDEFDPGVHSLISYFYL